MFNKIAVVRVRGKVHVDSDIQDTLAMLRLYNKNHCVFIDPTAQNIGMIKKVKDHVTFGKADEETYKLVAEKRGEEYVGKDSERKYVIFNNKKLKKFFRLNPPRGGYGRKGIKKQFKLAGALGDRKGKINDLLRRMI